MTEGAATQVWCAVSPQLDGKGGVYCQNVDIAPLIPAEDVGTLNVTGVSPWAVDESSARRLWELSEMLTGVTFTLA